MIEDVVKQMLAAKAEYERLEELLTSLVCGDGERTYPQRASVRIKQLLDKLGPLTEERIVAQIVEEGGLRAIEVRKSLLMLRRSGVVRDEGGNYSLEPIFRTQTDPSKMAK